MRFWNTKSLTSKFIKKISNIKEAGRPDATQASGCRGARQRLHSTADVLSSHAAALPRAQWAIIAFLKVCTGAELLALSAEAPGSTGRVPAKTLNDYTIMTCDHFILIYMICMLDNFQSKSILASSFPHSPVPLPSVANSNHSIMSNHAL